MYLLRKLCICNCIYYNFFKVIVVVSIIRKKCVIVIVSIIHFSSIVPSSAYGMWVLLTCYTWNNSMNASTEGIIIIFYIRAYNAISSIHIISYRIMVIHFQVKF